MQNLKFLLSLIKIGCSNTISFQDLTFFMILRNFKLTNFENLSLMSDVKVVSGLVNLASKIFLKFHVLNGLLQKNSIFLRSDSLSQLCGNIFKLLNSLHGNACICANKLAL